MNLRLWISTLLLALALPAVAQFRTVQVAHEVALSDLRLPGSIAGTLGFKTCDECEYQTERVSAETRWLLDGRSVSLPDFRKGLARVSERDQVWVTVLYHIEEDWVTEVSVYLP